MDLGGSGEDRGPAPAGSRKPFRFSFSAAEKYHKMAPPSRRRRPLFQRWEAVGLLLLVTVGAAFIPWVSGAPAAGTVLMEAAARGDLRARLFSFAPPALALLMALRASGRLARPFSNFAGVAMEGTLSAVLVFLAFQLGLYLALQTRTLGLAPGQSTWLSTVPGALAGWALLLIVASIRLLARRAASGLEEARAAFLSRREDG